MKTTIINGKYDTGDNYSHIGRYHEMERPELPDVGKAYLVYERKYVGPNRHYETPTQHCWTDDERWLAEGMPGNSDWNVRRFHGWRGTTDDWSVYCYGVRKCLKIVKKDFQKSARYHITWGADQKRGEE